MASPMTCPKCSEVFDPEVTPPKKEIGRTKLYRIFCPMCGVPSPAIEFMKEPPVSGMGVPLQTAKMGMGTEDLGPNGKPLSPSQKLLSKGLFPNMFSKGGKGIPINVPSYPPESWMPRVAARIAQEMDDDGDYAWADLADSTLFPDRR